jgi:hypothetical protein
MKKAIIPMMLLAGIVLVPLMALAGFTAMAPTADAVDVWPCIYTGYALVDDVAVPDGTGIRVLTDGTVIGNTTTSFWPGMDDNQYYLDNVIAEPGTEVNFQIWDDGLAVWLPADETAIHVIYDRVEIDLHAWTGTPVSTPIPTPTPTPTPTHILDGIYPCAYTGHAFVEGAPVPADTGIRVLEDSTVLGNTSTGIWELDDNQYYLDGVVGQDGTEVNFEIWDDGFGDWLPADETAIHVLYGIVEVDLHAFMSTLHITVNPFLFIYTGPNYTLPEALTNIGPPSAEYPDALDVVGIVWGTTEVEGAWEWVSFDPVEGAGLLGDLGLENGLPYVMKVEEGGVCNDWEMPH